MGKKHELWSIKLKRTERVNAKETKRKRGEEWVERAVASGQKGKVFKTVRDKSLEVKRVTR